MKVKLAIKVGGLGFKVYIYYIKINMGVPRVEFSKKGTEFLALL